MSNFLKLMAAANQDDPKAQYALGCKFYEGDGVAQDHSRAAQWLQCAAEQGHASAQFVLGALCEHGEGVPHDNSAAFGWF